MKTKNSKIYKKHKLFFQWNQLTHSFQNLFLYKTLHVSGSSSAHHQELAAVHSALAHVIQVWRQLACRIRMELCSILILNASCITCASAECTAANSWWWAEELSETCRVLYKNKFWNECVSWFHWKSNLLRYTVTWTYDIWLYTYISTAYGLDGPGIESRCGETFRTSPDRPWVPPSLLYNGYRG